MKRKVSCFPFLLLFIVAISGCSQTKQYTSQPVRAQYTLKGMPSDLVRVQVNDFRGEKEDSELLIKAIKRSILNVLYHEKITGNRSFYKLQVDIIEHRSFCRLGNWNASTKLRIRLMDSQSNVIGKWIATGNAHRSNMWGYATANALSQDSYNIAIADMRPTLSAVSLVK